MAIESSLTREVAKTGENKKSQLEWPSPDLSRGSYLGDSDSESISVTSSVFGSSSSATSSLDHESSNIKEGTGRKKTLNKSNSKKLSTFRSFMSSRRRAQSRLSQPSTSSPDDGSTSQLHRSMVEVSDASPDYVQKPMSKFTRTGSLRTLRIFKNKSKSSIKSKKPLTGRSLEISEELRLERATFSSTLKDSKFPEQLEPQGGPVESQEVLPVAKFCPYQHCSLHGLHHHHEPPAKRFPYLKRRSSKYQKSVNPEKSSVAEKRSVRKSEVKVNKKVSKREPDILDETKGSQKNSTVADNKDGGDFSIEFYAKTRSEPLIGASHTHDDADFADMLFGVNSFQDNQNEVGNFLKEDQDSSAVNIDMKSEEMTVSNLQDSIDTKDGKKGNPDGSTRVEANKTAFKKGNHMSMWRMIHRHMVSGLASEPGNEQQVDEENRSSDEEAGTSPETKDFDNITANDDAVSQETEIRKMFAIKLVREAIEKILLPEVQDNQSTTSEVISEQDLSEKNHGGEAITIPPPMTDPKETQAANDGSGPGGESVGVMVEKKAEEMVEKKTEKRAPKSWSYLKKVILLRRFVKELEKVKKFNPRKPRHLPLVPEPESETVFLRRQTVGEKKNSDEWMLDYALRQVVSELAPTQKRKVALLVKAFETVAPTNEDQSIKEMTPKFSDITGKESSLNDRLQRVGSHVKGNFQDANEASTCSRTDSDMKSKAAANSEASSIADSSEQLTEAGNGKKNERKLDVGAKREGGNQLHVEKVKHIKMWHMIYQHVATDIATKVGSELLLDGEESVEGEEKNLQEVEHQTVSNYRLGFTQSDVVKLVRESVDEILLPEVQDDSSPDTRLVASDISSEQELVEKNKCDDWELRKVEKDFDATENQKPTDEGAAVTVTTKLEQQKSKNWNKLKKLIMLKRSIKALESFRKVKPQVPQQLAAASDPESERVDLRRQMMDERKKAEQWMLDYAVQHIVTKLTPARKRRVAMLVEAFEAVVPLPEI